ncbi:hypothetical protein [Pandoraea sp. ISTKB]|uniref:hypothetical protein n=1 Tax=Pandoraea sp. ISTKB TaxID=1586708 RepID=UPI00084682DC|nr:hypothetical protein [Pandoraea sp. ISTKB]ODP35072.1 hypothetical protein A9762_11970 [Pandoraea sp. ISTKB]
MSTNSSSKIEFDCLLVRKRRGVVLTVRLATADQGDRVTARQIVKAEAANAEDLRLIFVKPVEGPSNVSLCVTGTRDSKDLQIARIEKPREGAEAEYSEAFEAALFQAMLQTASGDEKSKQFLTPGKIAFGTIVCTAALAMAGYGMLHKPADPALSMAGDPNLTARIEQQIKEAVAKGDPSQGLLQGNSVTMSTMRAMGLDPGKANTGCLVGVR